MNLIIIDDEKIICQGLSTLIETNDWDWKVKGTFVNPEDALSTCNWEEVQCVLMDINMPMIDGLSMAHILNERDYDIDIIFITAYSTFEFAQKAIDEHPLAYLLKPISKEALKQSLDKAKASYEKKKAVRSSPDYIITNLDDLRKVFLGNYLFGEKDFLPDDIAYLKQSYYLIGKKFALYEVLTEESYKQVKNLLRTQAGEIEWYIFGHAYFFVIVFLYTGDAGEIDQIITNLNCSFCIGEKEIQNLELLPERYQYYLPFIREHYNNTEAAAEKEDLPIIENPEELSITILQVIRYIDENLDKPLTLQSISTSVYLHPTYLSNVFKKQTGLNLMSYINQRRIQEAKKLLKDPSAQISWVLERVGFVNRKYFEKVFKDVVGMTPTQYKQDIYFKNNNL